MEKQAKVDSLWESYKAVCIRCKIKPENEVKWKADTLLSLGGSKKVVKRVRAVKTISDIVKELEVKTEDESPLIVLSEAHVPVSIENILQVEEMQEVADTVLKETATEVVNYITVAQAMSRLEVKKQTLMQYLYNGVLKGNYKLNRVLESDVERRRLNLINCTKSKGRPKGTKNKVSNPIPEVPEIIITGTEDTDMLSPTFTGTYTYPEKGIIADVKTGEVEEPNTLDSKDYSIELVTTPDELEVPKKECLSDEQISELLDMSEDFIEKHFTLDGNVSEPIIDDLPSISKLEISEDKERSITDDLVDAFNKLSHNQKMYHYHLIMAESYKS